MVFGEDFFPNLKVRFPFTFGILRKIVMDPGGNPGGKLQASQRNVFIMGCEGTFLLDASDTWNNLARRTGAEMDSRKSTSTGREGGERRLQKTKQENSGTDCKP